MYPFATIYIPMFGFQFSTLLVFSLDPAPIYIEAGSGEWKSDWDIHILVKGVYIIIKEKVYIICKNVIRICASSKHVHLLANVQLFTKLSPKYIHHLSFYIHLFSVYTILIDFHIIEYVFHLI